MSTKTIFKRMRCFPIILMALIIGSPVTHASTIEPLMVEEQSTAFVRTMESSNYSDRFIVELPEITKRQEIDGDFDIFEPSHYTKEQLSIALQDDNRNGLLPYVDAFLKAEKDYGVNALYLMCKFGLESGWGKYTAAKNNIGGWTNNDGTYKEFESIEQCILYISKNISIMYRELAGNKLADICRLYSGNDDYTKYLIDIMRDRETVIRGGGL